jgi:hypothetical protein
MNKRKRTFEDFTEMREAMRRSENVNAEVIAEREWQFSKWGPQTHPCLDVDLLASGCSPEKVALFYGIPDEYSAKAAVEVAAETGALTWADIAIEELSEAVCAFDPHKRRVELVQLAAVIVAWIDDIDTRHGKAQDK